LKGKIMRSDKVKKGVERTPHRALLYSTGVTRRALEKRWVERGVEAGGGLPFVFGIPAICDGIAMGHLGMKYSLPSRELIADSIESIAQAHCFDGLVLLTSCDKITPGMSRQV